MTIASLAVGLWLFTTSTAEACRERDDLRRASERLEARRAALLDATIRLRQRRVELPHNPDLLMVELDRLGLLPEEALERFLIEPR